MGETYLKLAGILRNFRSNPSKMFVQQICNEEEKGFCNFYDEYKTSKFYKIFNFHKSSSEKLEAVFLDGVKRGLF